MIIIIDDVKPNVELNIFESIQKRLGQDLKGIKPIFITSCLHEQDDPANYPILDTKATFKCPACLDDRLSRPGTKCYRCDKY